MATGELELCKLLDYIEPAELSYDEWLSVGMALKHERYSCEDWDNWSRRDSKRFHDGECARKWEGFHGTATPITGATITQMAKDRGWERGQVQSGGGCALSWDAIIGGKDDHIVIDKPWIEGCDITEPSGDKWHPSEQITRYLKALFRDSDKVGYVVEVWEKDDQYFPTKGCSGRSAAQLIAALQKHGDDIGAVFGDYNKNAGAWIRFNPLDGNGVKNENVTEFRYALVESDSMPVEQQYAIIRELELPVACLVHSGGKSLHAIVRIEADGEEEYRKRVNFLYDVCKKNGFEVDKQNCNPSRLSRLPGVTRKGHKQFIVDTNMGKKDWAQWHEWIEGVNDDLPEPENLSGVWDNMPELSPPLIHGVLRQGHKLMLAGPSKAGKSFALIELCCAIAEGRDWLGWPCAKGRVLYVNLELDKASCMHRFKDVYNALGWDAGNRGNIDMWNLRGKALPMDKLAPKLIRRAQKKGYIAIVIDPIYKIITGDENSADQMARFCNQFDRVCGELGVAVIICHHHSKGSQGQKRSMDRASGSGVFARDPDALLDLIDLEISDDLREQQTNRAVCDVCAKHLNTHSRSWDQSESGEDALLVHSSAIRLCEEHLTSDQYKVLQSDIAAEKAAIERVTAWRIEGTLREFPSFAPVNLWFRYPVHKIDVVGVLSDVDAEGGGREPWAKATMNRKKSAQAKKQEANKELVKAVVEYANMNFGRLPTTKELAVQMDVNLRTLQDRIKNHPTLTIDKNNGNLVIEQCEDRNDE